MATILSNGQVKLDNGSIISPQQGGWYDGQQFWGGTLSNAGQINSQSNQQGAGQQVSNEVIAQTNPNNVAYVQQQRQQAGLPTNGGGTGTGMGTGISGIGGDGSLGTIGANSPDVPNLTELYKNLYSTKGIKDLEDKLAQAEQGYNDNVSKINDNPWLSEGNRVGRIQKLTTDYNNGTNGIRNDLATRKADIETEIGIQTKQFDINSQAATQALSQFNTLLSSGALDSADPNTIAQITRATGLSSGAIMSAIKANQAKNVQTSVIQYDDGTNQGFAVVNTQTGEIINRQVVGASKPSASSGKLSASEEKAQYVDSASQDARSGVTLKDMIAIYAGILDPQTIYTIYNANSRYGVAKEDKNALAKFGIKI